MQDPNSPLTVLPFLSFVGGGVLLIVLVWAIAIFNRFAALKNHVRESWSGVDIALQRRHDLIPNLVETVKAFAAHEQSIIDRVLTARQHITPQLTIRERSASELELTSAMMGLVGLQEAYPDLKSSQHFLTLQRELANTEDRIAAARRLYNANVRDLNIAIQSFPSSLFAGLAVARETDYFEMD